MYPSPSYSPLHSFYRYLPRQKIEDILTEKRRAKGTGKGGDRGDVVDDGVIKVLEKKGSLNVQYAKRVDLKLSNMNDSFHQLGLTYWEIETVIELMKSNQKFKNQIEDLVEAVNPNIQPRKKGEDPTKKISREALLTFKKDLKEYKAKNNFAEKSKIFYIDDHYPFMKEEFKKKGWVENPSIDSYFFDIKYTAAMKNIDLYNLYPGQCVNHIVGSGSFTKKVGLAKYLRGVVWECKVDVDAFFPRCYELTDSTGFFNFVQDFRGVEAYNRLKELITESQKVKSPAKENFLVFLEVCVLTTCLQKRINALTEFSSDPETMSEVDSCLIDILNNAKGRDAKKSFLLNKGCVKNSLLGELGFESKDDLINEFLARSQHKMAEDMLPKLYLAVETIN